MANVKYLSDNDGQVLPVTRDIAVLDENGVGIDSSYQKRLVSGVNIKTVNSHSLLGNGDIPIPKGEDAVNPFKGFYFDPSDAPEGDLGDYIFVPDGTSSVRIHTWDKAMSEWEDTGIDIDPGALAEFQSGERVSATIIDNTSLETPATNSIPKATDVKAQLDKVKTASTSDCDLKFCDENDYAIVKFQGGHIITKNFDSSSITSYSKLTGKTYSILGDSISTFHGTEPSYTVPNYDGASYAYFYPYSTLDNVSKTWFKKMEAITGLEMLNNASWSGSEMCGNSQSTTSAEAGCSTRRVTDLNIGKTNTPDIIIVYIGINDMNTYTLGDWTADETIPAEGTITQFADAYALGLYKVMTTYPNAEVYCCSLLECATVDAQSTPKTFPCINSHGESLRDYNKAIEEISKGIGANFIDLHACGITYWNRATYLFDNTHPNENGTTLIAKYISSQILAQTKLKY